MMKLNFVPFSKQKSFADLDVGTVSQDFFQTVQVYCNVINSRLQNRQTATLLFSATFGLLDK